MNVCARSAAKKRRLKMDFQFLQLVMLMAVPMVQGQDLELLDSEFVAKKAVELTKAIILEGLKVDVEKLVDEGCK